MSFIGQPTTYLDFGAVKINKFPKGIPCTTNADYCQPTIQDDDIAFQFEVAQSEELIVNGDFQAGALNWIFSGWFVKVSVITGNVACQFATNSNNLLVQTGILTINDFYKVTVTVSDRTSGSVSMGGGTSPNIFNLALTAQDNGAFTVFFQYNESGGNGDFIITGSSTFDGCVDNVSVVKISDISDYTIQIHDFETSVLIDTVPTANLSQTGTLITVAFNWTDDVTVTNGCRMIRIFDNTTVFEDDFTNDQGWTLQTDITISGGTMTFLSSGVTRSAKIGGVFTPGEAYQITYDTTITGSGTSQVNAGKTDGTARTVSGTFIETLTATFNGNLLFSFTGAAASTVDIDNITIIRANGLDGQSECYDLQASHDCSLLLKWSNDDKWGGFDYSIPTENPFVNRLRIIAKFRGSKYPSTKIIGETSAGVKSVDYSTMRKSRILDVWLSPDYIHDSIAAMFVQDVRLIEDIDYILVDEYEPSAPNDSVILFKDFMTSRSELEPTVQPNQINRNE